eukprot:206010_1
MAQSDNVVAAGWNCPSCTLLNQEANDRCETCNLGRGSTFTELWGKRTKVISEKRTKKRVLIEWHFVLQRIPHEIAFQHTQDMKTKTRRMLWVDGTEKYNNKSSASSFRIEMDDDVIVVCIDRTEHDYQYRLTLNTLSLTNAFERWKTKCVMIVDGFVRNSQHLVHPRIIIDGINQICVQYYLGGYAK